MPKHPLATYLRDHFAGSRLAIDLLDDLRKEHGDETLSAFAANLLKDIKEDREVLDNLVERVGSGRFVLAKEAAAFLVEKLTWLKLRVSMRGDLGAMEALETIALGIQGKRSLWKALAVVANEDARLAGVDFQRLIERAEEQHERVEVKRLELARSALPRRTDGRP